ncbi:hypothetical protein [Deinococcus aquaticus]|uniref:Uncharacterized protein n=1 Tax=Deinococcus aquaticus TaxID=328692 RepID=A0ABY7UZF2_9DEIO|nr:hypothetical protein [Deinococcus aquaticus]WDA57966.1 hypothetical protein M8445_11465 [Deinococcus aquaticus]
MFEERHQAALSRQAQLLEEARAAHVASTLRSTGVRRWHFTWHVRPITLHLPVLQLTATQAGGRG